MATILDELVVTLGLSSKGFDSGADAAKKKLEGIEGAGAKAAERTKKVGEESESAAKGLGSLSTKMASFLALIGGTVAIKSFIKDTIETNTQLYFMSRNLDMSVQGLYALGAAAQEIGIGKGSLQQLAAQLKQIPGQLLAGQTPTLLPLLARAGISFDQSPQQIMLGLARYFSTMPASVALGLGTSYGLSYDQMTFLLQGVQKVQSAFERDKKFAPTDEQAKKFAAMKQQIADIGLAFTKLGYDLVSKAAPILEKVFGLLMKFAEWAQEHQQLVSSFLVALAAGIGAVSVATIALSASMVGFNPIILAVVAAIAALSGAIAYLAQDYDKWANGEASTFDWTQFKSNVEKAGEAWKSLKQHIDEAIDSFDKWAEHHGVKNASKRIAAFYWNHFTLPGLLGIKLGNQTPDATRRIGQAIAQQEGFNTQGTIPQRANNPGDIEWGDFARRHGATSYLDAAGGQKIAVFPDVEHGWSALYALWNSKMRSGKSVTDALNEWSGNAPGYAAAVLKNANISSGSNSQISNLHGLLSAFGGSHGASNSHTDNSVTNNVGTVNIHGNGQSAPATPSAARGMDWTTILMQSNYGLTG